jgi:hypothetical protein
VGILGGSAGTTRDAFQMLYDAQKYGARVALYGRKINNAENQLAFIHFLRLIVDGQIGPVDAVKAYHAVLGKLGVRPHRLLEDDLKTQDQSMSYGGSTSVVVPPKTAPESVTKTVCGCHAPKAVELKAPSRPAEEFPTRPGGLPDFGRMDVTQRLAYHRKRLGLCVG